MPDEESFPLAYFSGGPTTPPLVLRTHEFLLNETVNGNILQHYPRMTSIDSKDMATTSTWSLVNPMVRDKSGVAAKMMEPSGLKPSYFLNCGSNEKVVVTDSLPSCE